MTYDIALIVAAALGQALDIGTTATALASGRCREVVWPTQSAWIIGGVKVVATVALSYGLLTQTGSIRYLFLAGLVGAVLSGFIAGTLNYLRCIRGTL